MVVDPKKFHNISYTRYTRVFLFCHIKTPSSSRMHIFLAWAVWFERIQLGPYGTSTHCFLFLCLSQCVIVLQHAHLRLVNVMLWCSFKHSSSVLATCNSSSTNNAGTVSLRVSNINIYKEPLRRVRTALSYWFLINYLWYAMTFTSMT